MIWAGGSAAYGRASGTGEGVSVVMCNGTESAVIILRRRIITA